MNMYGSMAADELERALVGAYDLDPVNRTLAINQIFRRGDEIGGSEPKALRLLDASMRSVLTHAEKDEKKRIEVAASLALMPIPEDVLDNEAVVLENLEKSAYGKPVPNYSNFMQILRINPKFETLRYNSFTNRIELRGKPFTDDEAAEVRAWIAISYGGSMHNKDIVKDCIRNIANERRYDSLIEAIDALPPWDGVKRCESFLVDVMKADDTPYTREMSRVFFAGAINRAYKPGCKFDEMIILIGEQGCGKSTVARMLAMYDSFYTDSVQTFEGNVAIEAISGSWICEVGEMGALKVTKTRERAKAFISAQEDKYRLPYDTYATYHPRRCVFIGTSNDHDFLTDPTGNRRFHPVEVHSKVAEVGSAKTVQTIRQCWAEARDRMKADDPTFKPMIDAQYLEDCRDAQEDAMDIDPYQGVIDEYVGKIDPKDFKNRKICVLEIWEHCYGGDIQSAKSALDRKHRLEIAALLNRSKLLKRCVNPVRVGKYGLQKVWERVPVTVPMAHEADAHFLD